MSDADITRIARMASFSLNGELRKLPAIPNFTGMVGTPLRETTCIQRPLSVSSTVTELEKPFTTSSCMKKVIPLLTTLLLHLAVGRLAQAQGTAFTYQGRLNSNGAVANGLYDVQFAVFTAAVGGSQIGSALTVNAVTVNNGLFTLALDFGVGVFTGADRWLDLSVKTNGAASFTALTTRQPITATPYATTAGSVSGTVPDARLSANVGLLAASQTFTGTKSFSSEVAANSGLRLNNSNLWLRSDNNHGLGWYGNGKPFAAVSNLIDGPVLFGYGGGALAAEQYGTERIALLWNSVGNVGIGTVTPSVKLDVVGAIRASGGVVFPDGSTQYRATDSAPLVTSGLPNGSTFTVNIGGTAATLSGQYRLTHPILTLGGSYSYNGNIISGGAIKVRRPRTADLTWQGWPMAGTSRPLTLLLSVPGGSTVTWSGSVYPLALNLTQSGGTFYEELELSISGPFSNPTRLSRTASGAPVVSAPTGDLPGITLSLNGSLIPSSSFFAPFASTRTSLDSLNGVPTGIGVGPVVHLRANPFSNQVLYSRFVAGTTFDTAIITAGGGTLITTPTTLYAEYVLRLADDGLPIEEFLLQMNLF